MFFQSADAARRLVDSPAVGWRRAIEGSNLTALDGELARRVQFTPLALTPFPVRVHALERPAISILAIASEGSYQMRRPIDGGRVAIGYAEFASSFAVGARRSLAPGDFVLVRGDALDARAGGKSGIVWIDLDVRAFPKLEAMLPAAEQAVLTSCDRLATMRLRGYVRTIASMCASELLCVSEDSMCRIVEGELVACLCEAISKSAIAPEALTADRSSAPVRTRQQAARALLG